MTVAATDLTKAERAQPQKPRLWRRFGIWSCMSPNLYRRSVIVGYGYTPAGAYAEWAKSFQAQVHLQ